MSTEKQSDLVAIIIAVITLLGALGTALFTNWDKVFKPQSSVSSSPLSTQVPTSILPSPELPMTSMSPSSPPLTTLTPNPLSTISKPVLIPPTQKSEIKVEDNDYRVQLQSCKRSNEKVKCDFRLTNLADKDRYFRL
jgi:hypothetical protein